MVLSLCFIIGVLIFQAWLKNIEVRYLLFWNVVANIINFFFVYVQANRWNIDIGYSDIAYLFTISIIFGALTAALCVLPIMALFARITPHKIEGAVFALLTGVNNLDQFVL